MGAGLPDHLAPVQAAAAMPADVDVRDRDGNTPLIWAVRADDSAILSLLLQRGADPNAANAKLQTALHYVCAEQKTPAMLEILLAAGAEPNDAKLNTDNLGGWTLLHAGAHLGNLEVVDAVKIPADLPPGKYVLQWRWDCEESDQIWASCSDVAITSAAVEQA